MRNEVVKAVEQVKYGYKTQQSWPNRDAGIGEVPPSDYSFVLSEEQKENLERVYEQLNSLKSCLQLLLDTASIYTGTSTSLEIQWELPKSQVVIELSLYEPFAAVFVYGEIPEMALQHIDKCLSLNDLTRLSDEEIKQLEKHGVYRELF